MTGPSWPKLGGGMPGLTERDAGVAGAAPGLEALLRWVRPTFAYAENARPTLEIGYFANVVPVAPNLGIAISTDGVGTKLLVAQAAGRFDTVGIDCVAMNVNDVLCVGARPIALVDYVALEEPTPALLDALGRGLAHGCELAGVSRPVGFDVEHWPEPPPVFELVQRLGDVPAEEMFRVFNMGIGFVLVVAPEHADAAEDGLRSAGVGCHRLGRATDDATRTIQLRPY